MNNREYLQKLEDPTYLPSREEILQRCQEGLCHILRDRYERSKGKLEHEFVTQELVQGLTDHLSAYRDQERISILEVCAGNGRLAYHMQKSLQEKYGDTFDYHAVDNGDQDREKKLPLVENIDNAQGLKKYNPDIIICSRLPIHPYSVLPMGFSSKFEPLKNKPRDKRTEQEEKDLAQMYLEWSDAHDGKDATHDWRQNPNLREYILIGRTSGTGNSEKTHGYKDGGYIPKYIYESHSKEELEEMFSDENALFIKDGFIKKELDIPTINRINAMFGFKDKEDNSQIFSFKRKSASDENNKIQQDDCTSTQETIQDYRTRYDKLYNI